MHTWGEKAAPGWKFPVQEQDRTPPMHWVDSRAQRNKDTMADKSGWAVGFNKPQHWNIPFVGMEFLKEI